jgi:hypothetical protein
VDEVHEDSSESKTDLSWFCNDDDPFPDSEVDDFCCGEHEFSEIISELATESDPDYPVRSNWPASD